VITRLSLELADTAVHGGLDWGPVSSWVAATVTFLAVMVALFGQRMWECWRRPRLEITFDHAEPFCREAPLQGGKQSYWVRVKVQNRGADPARSCVGKLSKAYTAGRFRADRDPVQLRWCGVPYDRGFEPVHLASTQYEFLNVFKIVQGVPHLWIVTHPDLAPGFGTFLEESSEHLVEVSVFADNAEPKSETLTVTYSGDFDALPDSLTVTLGNRMRRS
jgi:hypothetical protein